MVRKKEHSQVSTIYHIHIIFVCYIAATLRDYVEAMSL